MNKSKMVVKDILSDEADSVGVLSSFEDGAMKTLSHWMMTKEVVTKNEDTKKIENAEIGSKKDETEKMMTEEVEANEKDIGVKVEVPTGILKLPDEMLLRIFKYCTSSKSDCLSIRNTCKRFEKLVEDWSLFPIIKIEKYSDIHEVLEDIRQYSLYIKRVDIDVEDPYFTAVLEELKYCKKLQVINICDPNISKQCLFKLLGLASSCKNIKNVYFPNAGKYNYKNLGTFILNRKLPTLQRGVRRNMD